jgi:glycosyltransferase involved in cell wall biosynthesis
MSAGPKVTVVTPTRNRAVSLAETLDSVAAQTLPDWEHLVVDDGSDDGTAELVAERRRADSRLRYIQRTCAPPGANACRNIGIRAAAAPFVVLLDSDDLLAPTCLERRVQVMSHNAHLDFVTFQAGLFEHAPGDLDATANPDLIGDDLCRFLYFETPWQTTAPIWRRETLLRLGLFDEALLSWQDVELHVRAIAAGCRYIRFPEVDYFFRYRVDPTKTSFAQHRSVEHLAGALDVFERLEAHVRAGPGMNWVRQRALCSLYFATAQRWVERGDLGPALAVWRRIRERGLGPPGLHLAGAALLVLARTGLPSETLIRKWRGRARLRTLPEIVPA